MTSIFEELTVIPQLSTEEWRDDVRVFAAKITQQHRNPYHHVTKAVFDAAVADLEAQTPTLQAYEIVVGLQRLAAMIGDGHTFLDTDRLYHIVPLELFWFGNELRVVRAASPYQDALGARVVSIGDWGIDDVQQCVQALIPQGENTWYTLHHSANLLTRVEPLAALSVLPNLNHAPFTFEDNSKQRFTLQIRPVRPTEPIDWMSLVANPPLFLQYPKKPFWFEYLPDAHSVYVQFRSYENLDRDTEHLLAFIRQHTPKRLVIDMRRNGGGNYTLGRSHLIYPLQMLPTVNRAGHLFVITGRATFSAAMTNTTDFRRETEAILVGEPTGARPNGYQELAQFTLSHSGLRVGCAVLRYRFHEADTPAVFPDVAIDPNWEAYRAGRDPVMEWILAQVQ